MAIGRPTTLWVLSFVFGFFIGFNAFCGVAAPWMGLTQIWLVNPEVSDAIKWFNIVLMSFYVGFAGVGMSAMFEHWKASQRATPITTLDIDDVFAGLIPPAAATRTHILIPQETVDAIAKTKAQS